MSEREGPFRESKPKGKGLIVDGVEITPERGVGIVLFKEIKGKLDDEKKIEGQHHQGIHGKNNDIILGKKNLLPKLDHSTKDSNVTPITSQNNDHNTKDTNVTPITSQNNGDEVNLSDKESHVEIITPAENNHHNHDSERRRIHAKGERRKSEIEIKTACLG